MGKLYLGIDGGGTKTEAVVIDQNKKVVAGGSAKGSNANVLGLKNSSENIFKAIKSANINSQFENSFIALAGVDTNKNKLDWQKALEPHPKFTKYFSKKPHIENDIVAALRSGTEEKNAIAIIAGTGSGCWGKNELGKEAKCGGQDYILSDEGSGYEIGLTILKKATRDLDQRGPKTLLTKLLFENLKIKSLEELHTLVYKNPWNKTDIAKIAPLAELAAEKNDPEAMLIIKKAAIDLGVMIKTVAKRLDLKDKSYSIVKTGSVFNIQKILSQEIEKEIISFSPKAKFTKPEIDSATAAAFLAYETN